MNAPTTRHWDDFAKGFQMISVFDTRICDNNLGNHIIMEAVDHHLEALFPDAFQIRLPYLDSLGAEAIRYLNQSAYAFFGGTNALSSDIQAYRQWGLDLDIARQLGNVILMGVGWWQYQGDPTPYTRDVLTNTLDRNRMHSVRDSYTYDKLRRLGFDNVLMTGCPSLWEITPEHCTAIPTEKAENVLLTLTHYSPDASDTHLVNVLRRHYRKVFLWIQGPEDYLHAARLGGGFEIVQPSLAALDRLLHSELSIDCIGTRLHAGVRAIAAGRRTIIIGVDNRALEMGKDVGLPVLPRQMISRLEELVSGRFALRVQPPTDAISAWKSQFTA
ncbi:polysaccharide pyruvyl transferase family protein [Azospirillum sp. YIM B02556]|uniref:Polysaccharide pyruvyl transferase family protein n=1 Tax=Azospirillum endophyticum TaxID=2800326 RepID=A0ABS1FBB7_9PROT|nr:polysaccharide pyruvyl transferase family protein [Azospirillum endophyticum]MBK1840714.1 polysaccharide pyruvyl transferase family protein [Azospirillum endophyticum]